MPDETKTVGTGSPSPEQERINWVSLEDAEKLQRYIGRQYVRKDNPKDAKLYFYKVIDIFPYQPSSKDPNVMHSTEQLLYKFNVQKYYRNKMVKVTRRDDKGDKVEVQANQPVDGHENRGGNFICVDPWASFPLDSAKFIAAFTPDTED